MKQEEILDRLIELLLVDSKMSNIKLNSISKQGLFRSLTNVREPHPLSQEYLDLQDQYLSDALQVKGIVDACTLPNVADEFGCNHKLSKKISLWQGDITRLKVEAIVNAANAYLLGCFIPMHKCIDNAIHSSAGLQLRQNCDEYMKAQREKEPYYIEPTGSAFITPAYNLPSNYIIHTVGPIVHDQLNQLHVKQLRACYLTILEKAMKQGIRSIAFCCISTGEFRFPQKKAAEIAISTVNEMLDQYTDNFDQIIFNVYKESDYFIYKELLK